MDSDFLQFDGSFINFFETSWIKEWRVRNTTAVLRCTWRFAWRCRRIKMELHSWWLDIWCNEWGRRREYFNMFSSRLLCVLRIIFLVIFHHHWSFLCRKEIFIYVGSWVDLELRC